MMPGNLQQVFILVGLLLILFLSCSTPRWLKHVFIPEGTDTAVVYRLPYAPNKKYLVAQGYWGNFSHQTTYALDFKMRRGQPVHAAREGIVLATASHFVEKKGKKKTLIEEANFIDVLHNDGTVASYWHLNTGGVLVKPGDTIYPGQLIGFSGNTGFSTMPHLHFEVYKRDANGYHTIPTRFYTKQGIKFLRWGRIYAHP